MDSSKSSAGIIDKWLYTKWWKWMCIVLLFYVIVGSFMVPMGPGVSKVEPATFKPDSIYTFTITGYHTHFKNANAGSVQLWFKSGSEFYCPESMTISDDRTILAKFGAPATQKFKQAGFDVVVNDHIDGTFALREAIILLNHQQAASADSLLAQVQISLARQCPVEVQNNKTQFLNFPYREILYESIRNTFFHVPMWFVMTLMVFISVACSLLYLSNGNIKYDIYASQAVIVAILFGVCGYTTGMIWSKYTWFVGMNWPMAIRNMVFEDIKLAGALISIAVYLAYLVLRSSLTDEIKRARISAVYNVFAVVVFTLFVFIMPRLTDSLHPGNGGNPAFSKYDLDSTLRMFFYPAVIGWICLGLWILSIRIRLALIQQKLES